MTHSTQNHPNTDWNQAKQDNKQRAQRIADILKAAAAETFSEVKAGSADLSMLTRQSATEWLEAQKQAADAEAAKQTDAKGETDAEVLSWREILTQSLEIVQDRRGDWQQQLLAHLREQGAKFDADMTQEKGDRYLKVKALFQRLVSWLNSFRKSATHNPSEETVKPVKVEMIEPESTASASSTTAEKLEPSASGRPAQ